MKKKCVCLLSGGIDSSTLVYFLHKEKYEVFPLAVIYGQRHSKEIESAVKIANSLGLSLKIADLTSISSLFAGSALTSGSIAIPEGHYTDESQSSTVVPNRNMIFLSLAAAYALTKDCNYVAYAAHANDRSIYPDCRPEFADAVAKAIKLGTEKVTMLMPFINITKADIVKLGLRIGVPYSLTTSCDNGEEEACGHCGTCVERQEAFELNGVKDSIKYRS